ncbi:multiheme c-type cytochrome [Leptospira adleri]|uniref:multiheme c-type cytochrome n=1 Tax=Leptospira adleri TaxID=2023186 RepID=UPI001084858A|nr:multiheme c-type cytochrome [Leptospira adleri]TGM57800.1 cytochrome c554 and C-prime [Leptospira adleri]
MRRLIKILLERRREAGRTITIRLLLFFFANCERPFLESYWSAPIALQGSPQIAYGESEKSLDPNDCGTCHKEQFRKWNESLHSKAAGSGLQWQLKRLGEEKSSACFSCHSPLAETQEYFKKSKSSTRIFSYLKTGNEEHGILCASCHVRNHVRYGPPPRSGRSPSASSPHGGYVIRKEFDSSEFCSSCHESSEDGKKLNGKRMMETFSEWKRSRYATEGITCQNCHMPDRSHEWKGIHDPETARRALTSSFILEFKKEKLSIVASLTNTGAGHKFPTYSVPKIFISLSWVRNGKIYRPLAEKTIGRVTDIDLETEFEDTRLDPGESAVLNAEILESDWRKGDKVRFQAIVEPDEFYSRMFQENYDQRKKFGISGSEELRLSEALKKVKSSRYVLFEMEKNRESSSFE